jgi:WD40 repeat protein
MAQLRAEGFGEDQIVDLSAAGNSMLIHVDLPGRQGEPGRHDGVKFNLDALKKIERSLRLIGVEPESFEWKPEGDHPSPYPGLKAFTEDDAGVFFGRESQIADTLRIIDGLRRGDGSRLVTIIAASGAGKSSFLRAGLWRRLARQDGVTPLVVLRPGAGIISGREGGLIHELAKWFQSKGHTVAPGDILAHFTGRPALAGLTAALTEAARVAGTNRTLVLGIDQGEELFDTIDKDKFDEARQFLDALFTLLASPPAGIDLLAVVAIRADSFDPLDAALKRGLDAAESLEAPGCKALDLTLLRLPPLSRTAYRDVIRRPAQVALNTHRDVIELELADHLVDNFTGADALPLLAMTLDQLYYYFSARRRITLADYQALYGTGAGAEGPVRYALREAYRTAGGAGTDETLKRLLIPGLATWDQAAGETGAAKRRIAVRATLLRGDPDLTRLADELASEQVRLLTRGNAEAGPTLEVAHEALLRIQPVKGWIEEFSGLLKLRDEVEREASDWQNAQVRLVAARKQTAEGSDDLEAMQKAVDAAIAARRGPRLEAAMGLLANPVFARLIGSRERAYLDACQTHEKEQIDRQRRIMGVAFVKPAMQAVEDGRCEHALRLAAAGALLARDPDFKLVPELWGPAARAIFHGRTRAVLRGHAGAVSVASFSPDGCRIVTASDDRTARLWDSQLGTLIAVLQGHDEKVRSASFSPDGRHIVTASDDRTARLWDGEHGTPIDVLRSHANEVRSASFSPDGRRIVTASGDRTAQLWDREQRTRIDVLHGSGRVQSVSFSPDGRFIVIASDDHTARLWGDEGRKRITTLRGHTDAVRGASFSPDGRRIVTASDDRTVGLWEGDTGKLIDVLRGHASWVRSASFSPDGRRIVTASADGTARLWDGERGTALAVLHGHDSGVRSASFSPDSRRIVTASDDGTARLWEEGTRTTIAVLRDHDNAVRSASFSPDGHRIVTASDDGTARLWDGDMGRPIAVLQGHDEASRSASFSPDGPTVAITVSADGTAQLRDGERGTTIAVLHGAGQVQTASVSPDGRRIVTASDDRMACLWDGERGRQIAVLRSRDNQVRSAWFSPDGRHIVTASDDGTERLWDVSRTEVIVHERAIVLAAALSRGIGWLTNVERTDLLLQYAENDLYSEALKQIDRTGGDPEIAEVAAALAAPTQFAEKIAVSERAAPAAQQNPDIPNRTPGPMEKLVALFGGKFGKKKQ